MRLKRLDIKGFKSFATDTVIHFDEDVIGIVGPNGSGKSNIVDAIRWVLGEQKGKELRLEQMGDVIFNGTKKRKKGNIAQVSITFENTRNVLPTEYQTVTITRLLYRSGESEYRLNDVPCRLKDIRSLLLDTGIGSNSYAIIALGMVDDILHDKDHARRRMFEQAAGISKYKKRKHETLLKLKSTEGDLDRVEDLLFEIETNLKALEKQARRTKRYADLKEKYKVQSIDLAIRKVGSYQTRFQELTKQISLEKGVFGQLQADLSKREAQLAQVKSSSLGKEQAVSESQRDMNRLIGQIRTMENEKKLKEQKILFLRQSQEKLKAQLDSGRQKIAALETEITANSKALAMASKESQLSGKQLQGIQENHAALQLQYEQAKQARQDVSIRQLSLEDDILALEKHIAAGQELLIQLRHQQTTAQQERIALHQEISATDADLHETEMLRSRHTDELASLLEYEKDRQSRLEQLEEQIRVASATLKAISRTLDARQNEYALLKDMMENLEGYPESIKFLNKSKAWNTGAPLLSDVLYCEEPYRAALEHLLEPWLNYYVVESRQDATLAIELLSSHQKGKAHFFVLDQLPESEQEYREIPGARRMLDFVQYDEAFARLAGYLLGQVYITDDTPAHPGYDAFVLENTVLIDKNGQFFRKKISLSGGSSGLFEGKILGRKKHLEVLEKDIKKHEKRLAATEGVITAHQEEMTTLKAASKVAHLEQCRRQIAQLEQDLATHSAFVRHKTDRIQTLDRLIAGLAVQMETAQKALDADLRNLESKRAILAESSGKVSSADEAFHTVLAAFNQSSSDLNAARIEQVRAQNKVEAIERDIHFRQHQLEELQRTAESTLAQKQDELESIGKIELEIDAIQNDLIDNYGQKNALEKNLSEAEQHYFKARNEINELEEKIKSITRESQNSQYLVNQLKDEHQNLRFKLASVSERLDIEFGVALDDVMQKEIDTSLTLEELDEQISKLKFRLQNFGEINPMAVEAYEEMQERYNTINAQREDILQAKTSLLQTIQEIEVNATEKFVAAFEQARIYFIDVFRSLFTDDDSCDLILSDSENPLDSDILIIAKPKGKRPKTLSQLSGGEKTLTATALLFSLYLLKPAPFCIFDEVDAPLDDANVEKFNRIIKKFSRESQFVIVTHNKQTMAAVDVIYGVYMEEQGVSSLSPVDLRAFTYDNLLDTVSV